MHSLLRGNIIQSPKLLALHAAEVGDTLGRQDRFSMSRADLRSKIQSPKLLALHAAEVCDTATELSFACTPGTIGVRLELSLISVVHGMNN